jgi:hypothetical protein
MVLGCEVRAKGNLLLLGLFVLVCFIRVVFLVSWLRSFVEIGSGAVIR